MAHYLFLGPEIGEKQEKIAGIRKQLKNAEETVFYAGEDSVYALLAVMQNGALFAEARLFCIRDADLIKKRDETEALAAYLQAPQDNTTVIVISEEITISKVIERAIPPANKKVFYELLEQKKEAWIESFFRRNKRSITHEAVETILELVENNTAALNQECSRLLLFFSEDQSIDHEQVEQLFAHTRSESAFTLFSRIACNDFSKSIETVRTLLESKESPQAIMAGLAWCFRKLRDYLLLCETHEPTDSELRSIGLLSPKARTDYAAARRYYSCEAVDYCLAYTAEYDVLIRSSGNALESILMDKYLYTIVKVAPTVRI
ncbi:MAG: DNA polymerase III subunit delta [Treponema sp.]|jgi:DNA polymerase-3 subunit delta|nr:DNA polymerase III subunit delta [Treponema sp.]